MRAGEKKAPQPTRPHAFGTHNAGILSNQLCIHILESRNLKQAVKHESRNTIKMPKIYKSDKS